MKAVTTLILTGALALPAAGTLQAGTTYRVGTGCTYSSIQAAVDAIPSQGSGIIRIRGGTYNENIVITSKTVDLLGGHADCTTTNAPSITHIDASGSNSPAIAFLVIGGVAGSGHELTTDKLNLFEGTGNLLARGGGISVFTDADRTATVLLQRTFVRNNQTGYHGGGIAMYGNGNGSLALLENSQLEQNRVTGDDPYGGGLYCAGDYSVVMIGGSIHGNTAGEPVDSIARGGGIYLDGCDMNWFAQNQLATVDDAALRNNTVYGHGGGLYATGGAQVDLIGAHFTLFGDPASTRPLRIHNNRALTAPGIGSGLGGAIFAGFGARVRLDRAWTYNNHADNSGGAFEVTGELIVERSSETCHTPRRCSRVFGNTAAFHSVVNVLFGDVTFRRTIVSGNISTASMTDLMRVQTGGTLRIEDSLVYGNEAGVGFQAAPPPAAATGAELRIIRSTVAANTFADSVAQFDNDDTEVTIYDSIIHEPGTTMAAISGDPVIAVDCVVWHDDQLALFEIIGGSTLVGDPMFADPVNALFYLQPGSPAINYCDAAPPAPGVDLDWYPRGISHSGQPDVHGPYDLGAYEFPIAIFSDRFEH